MLTFEADGIKITEYQTALDGRKHYEIRYKTSHFCHISFLTKIPAANQNESDLLKLAKARFGWVPTQG